MTPTDDEKRAALIAAGWYEGVPGWWWRERVAGWARTLDEAFDCLSGNWYLDVDGAKEQER